MFDNDYFQMYLQFIYKIYKLFYIISMYVRKYLGT